MRAAISSRHDVEIVCGTMVELTIHRRFSRKFQRRERRDVDALAVDGKCDRMVERDYAPVVSGEVRKRPIPLDSRNADAPGA